MINQEILRLAKQTLAPFLLSRGLIFAILILSASTHIMPESTNAPGIKNLYLSFDSHLPIKENLKNILLSADSNWYLGIVEEGYTKERFNLDSQKNWAFFPLFPIIWKILSTLTSYNLFSILLFNNFIFFSSLLLLLKLGEELEFSERACKNAVWFLCFFPTSYFLSIPMTESLFLFLALGSFLALEKDKLILSGILAGLMTACRPTGLLLLPALALRLYQRDRFFTPQGLSALVLGLSGISLYFIYLGTITGNFLAWFDIQQTWGRGGDLKLFDGILLTGWDFKILSLAAAMLAVVSSLYFIKSRLSFFALIILVPIISSLASGNSISLTRFTLTLFPIFFFLGEVKSEKFILAVCSFLLGLMTLLYSLQVTGALT